MSAPRATYRLQFTGAFGFREAAAVAPYLAALGVSHVYASPYLKARPGSTHGYDIVAHEELNSELGSRQDFAAMHAQFAHHGLGQILDFVPNHMGVGGADNPLWLNVLEWGPESRFAGWFDIDWEPASRYLKEKLLVPVLGEQYGAVLEAGQLVLKFDAAAGEFAVWAYEVHKLPIYPLQYGRILGNEQAALENLADEFGALLEWRPQIERRADELKRELAELVARDADARASLERSLARLNGAEDTARRELDALIQAQYWRASHFRVAGDDINYRRFFNINDLAGLRMELPEVFEHTHRLVLRLLREGVLDGLRIDHVDGLLDPRGYLQRLRAAAGAAGAPRMYLVVEKILARDEALRRDWPVDGTTGYEFANLATGVLIDGRGDLPMARGYAEFSGERRPFEDIVRDSKLRIMRFEMSSELNVLARDTARVARQNPRTADFTRNLLRRALRELVATFPIYRTYLNSSGTLDDVDRRYLARALADARRHERDIDASVFDFLEGLLTGALVNAPRSGFSRHAVLRAAMKFQQYSGPVMAKGLEDTAFYRYNRLVALNEVGGHPDHFAVSPAELHAANAARAEAWPRSMLATSTHDTKRGEDARARLAVLSEMPAEWHAQVIEWSKALHVASAALQDANTEYLFYQLLLGSWPLGGERAGIERFRGRVQQAMLKSVREAKVRTSWSVPDENYEHALASFVNAAFDTAEFRQRFEPFQARVAALGMQNSLVQSALKLSAPGVPDIYQGSELWDLSMVDPDNRRAVDYALRARMLAAIEREYAADPAAAIAAWLATWQDGRIKLWLTWRLLKLRRDQPGLCEDARYAACEVGDGDADRVIAYERAAGESALLVAAARFPLARSQRPGWQSGVQPRTKAGVWRDVLSGARFETGERLACARLFAALPVAVLLAER
jgi:(1->4)-alpha-D-glucan 1-alpha-D-glucosylmutase